MTAESARMFGVGEGVGEGARQHRGSPRWAPGRRDVTGEGRTGRSPLTEPAERCYYFAVSEGLRRAQRRNQVVGHRAADTGDQIVAHGGGIAVTARHDV